jgi:IrrE N-terminal-like domain
LKDNANQLRRRLKRFGLSDPVINAAWPTWWSDAADASVSAKAELRFSLARKLGLDPHSLLDDDAEPRFIWRDEARFKHLSGESQLDLSAITSFGTALGRFLIAATAPPPPTTAWNSGSLRDAILHTQPYVRLVDLLASCWAIGIPIIHLRVFPRERKRMAAMVVRTGGRSTIMLARDSVFPPRIAFYLAHELAHVSLGHLLERPVLVDLSDTDHPSPENDPEEIAADRFAMELLTGRPEPRVLPEHAYNAPELARVSLATSSDLRIEPGTLALCFGFSTGDWPTANAALQRIYKERQSVWGVVNKIALQELALDLIPDDARAYVEAVLGLGALHERGR